MPHAIRPGDVLADRYQLVDLLDESAGGLFYRAHDSSLDRSVAVHIIRADDDARRAAPRGRPHLRPRASTAGCCGCSTSTRPPTRPLATAPRCASWSTSGRPASPSTSCSPTRARWRRGARPGSSPRWPPPSRSPTPPGVAHGRLVPENVLIDRTGSVRVIGFAVDAALHGLPAGRRARRRHRPGRAAVRRADRPLARDRRVGGQARTAGPRPGAAPAPGPRRRTAGARHALRRGAQPRRGAPGSHARGAFDLTTAGGIGDALREFVGDPAGLADAEAAAFRRREAASC